MRYEYDRETDILTIVLRDEEVDHGEQTENVITHYGPDGKAVEIELLDASETVLELIRPILARQPDPAEA
jgi:uncharacterized protein YuzE